VHDVAAPDELDAPDDEAPEDDAPDDDAPDDDAPDDDAPDEDAPVNVFPSPLLGVVPASLESEQPPAATANATAKKAAGRIASELPAGHRIAPGASPIGEDGGKGIPGSFARSVILFSVFSGAV